jgi:hypothetical protein
MLCCRNMALCDIIRGVNSAKLHIGLREDEGLLEQSNL